MTVAGQFRDSLDSPARRRAALRESLTFSGLPFTGPSHCAFVTAMDFAA